MVQGLLGQAKGSFGLSATYTPAATGIPLSITGIFSSGHQEVSLGHGAPVSSSHPTLGIQLSDLPAKPAKGDTVQIGSITYRVIDSDEDGQGGASLRLQK